MKRCYQCMGEVDGKQNICPHCGKESFSVAKESYHLQPGVSLINRYLVGVSKAYRGESIIYIGYDQILQQKVTVKEYFPLAYAVRRPKTMLVDLYVEEFAEPFMEGMNYFIREAKRLARFRDQKGIYRILDIFEENHTAYQIVESVEGQTLAERVAESGPISVEETIRLMEPIAQALIGLHKQGIIHRNITPDTIIIDASGETKLTDFGAARTASATATKSLSVMIRPGFTPEEQYVSSGNQGAWTDVYAFAATMYKCITGVTPEESVMRSRSDALKKPSDYGIQISDAVEQAILHALRPDVTERTLTMEDFLNELHSGKVQRVEDGKKLLRYLCMVCAGLVWLMGMWGAISYIERMMKPEFAVVETNAGQELSLEDLTGMNYEQARNEYLEKGIVLRMEQKVLTSNMAEGIILSQNMKCGTRLSEGMEVLVCVTAKQEAESDKALSVDGGEHKLEEEGLSGAENGNKADAEMSGASTIEDTGYNRNSDKVKNTAEKKTTTEKAASNQTTEKSTGRITTEKKKDKEKSTLQKSDEKKKTENKTTAEKAVDKKTTENKTETESQDEIIYIED